MGSPTSDDDPTRRVGGPGGWGQPGHGGPQYPGPPSPPPGQGPPYPQPGTGGYPPPGQGGGYPPPGQGSPYPPPGPGGYPGPDSPTTRFPQPEEQRGQTTQFPQVGYPPGGPGSPYPPQGPPPGAYGYGGAPGGPPPGSGGSRRGLVIALVAGLVILAGIAVALVFALMRDEGRTVAADRSTDAPTSSSAEPSPTESTSSAPSPSPTEAAGDRTDELLALVPADFTDCVGTELAGDGDVAAVECGSSTTQPGPQTAFFHLYEDTQTLDQVFVEDVESEGLGEMPAGEDCATAQGVTTWDVNGVEGGNIACAIAENAVVVAWTDREFGIEGVVSAPGTTQEELAELAEWWRFNSDFQG